MISQSPVSPSNQNQMNARTIRPIASSSIHGIAFRDNLLLAIDSASGYLMQIDPLTDNTTILNVNNWPDFIGATGLAIFADTLWFTTSDSVYFCSLNSIDSGEWNPQLFVRLSDSPSGVAVLESTVYVSCHKNGKILIFNRDTGKEITYLYAPGIGLENITIKNEHIWVSDTVEQSVYCLDKATGQIVFSLLTPFEGPSGLTFYTNPETGKETLYVAYASHEPYIRDNPNADPNHELLYRPTSFIHPLYFHYYPDKHYTLSNGYLIEMSYVEEISPLEKVEIKDLEWRIAMPVDSDRQKVKKIEWVGIPFREEIQQGQKVAVFNFDPLKPEARYVFGWKATLEVWSIKYQYTPRICEKLPGLLPEFKERYLVDDDDLAMDTDIIRRAAVESIGTETNLLRQIYSIRNYVYDKLSYGIKPHIDSPDIALKRGVGSCGEYLGILLALTRLNGIASRTVGRYKCPSHPRQRDMPLEPDYNHVWMEFYLPSYGWIPMESNPDDINEGGPYPTRFFMGLAWYHMEMAKEITFETITSEGKPIDKTQLSIGDLAINHVRFKILEELSPE